MSPSTLSRLAALPAILLAPILLAPILLGATALLSGMAVPVLQLEIARNSARIAISSAIFRFWFSAGFFPWPPPWPPSCSI